MVGARFPEAVFLRRSDNSGYGFFFQNEEDFRNAIDSFTAPILRSFAGEPVPGQPDPADHIKAATAALVGQAFDRSFPAELGAEGVSRAVAAMVRQFFTTAIPRVVVVERREGRFALRPGIEYLRHPGHPLAIVVDGARHGGDAHFFPSEADYRKAGESAPDQYCWLPQIVYRLYATTPSVMLGHPLRGNSPGDNKVACKGMNFGMPAALVERA